MALLTITVILLMLKRKRAGVVLLAFVAAGIWFWSTQLWCDFLTRQLESKYHWRPASTYPVADVIVSLGGGISGYAGSQYPEFDLGSAADRDLFAAELYHAGKAGVIIVSAGVNRFTGTGIAGLGQKRFLERLRVPAASIRVEASSLNTIDNAREVMRMLEPVKGKRILLVTSAQHMARSCWLFERTGLTVIPAPTDFSFTGTAFTFYKLLPDAGALEASTRAWKEILGLWLMKLFPPKIS